MHHRIKITTLILCLLLVASCIKEDMIDCPGDVRVYFSLISSQSNPAEVDRMHLYVFDDKGLFKGEYRDNRVSSFNAQYYIDCSTLMPGNYRFVAWAGKDDNHYGTSPAPFEKEKTTYNEALLALKHSGGLVTAPPHHIFHSERTAAVTREKVQRISMPLAQLTNTVNVRTEGLPSDDNAYLLNIADNNCAYSFDRSFASHASHSADETFTYTTSCTKDDAKQLKASLRVLRLSENRRIPKIEIYNKTQGKRLYPVDDQSGDLIGLILKAYSPNFETSHTYDILLRFTGDDATGFKVKVIINGWEINEEGGELID